MDERSRSLARTIANALLKKNEREWLDQIKVNDAGFGYDIFGFEKDSAVLAYLVLRNLYRYYFRVESTGAENIPSQGRCILASNHSGLLPIDGAMVGIDILEKVRPPRAMRAVVDNFAAAMPFVGVFLQRVGQVIGSRRNFEELLEHEELVMVFPEGTKGVGKPFRKRYQLQRFNVGFIELALEFKTPIVPVAVVGAEEQAPILGNLKALGRSMGFPFFPITPTFPLLGPFGMIPYPSKYHITYGEPIAYHEKYSRETLEQPEVVRNLAAEVQEIVQKMVNEGLRKRKHVYF